MTLQIGFWEIFSLMALGLASTVLALVGVWIGGYLVFKTRRDGSLFENPMAQGEAYQAGEEEEYIDFRQANAGLFHEDSDDEPPMGGDVDRIMKDRAASAEKLTAQIMGMRK